MKKTTLFMLLAMTAMTAGAQSKLDLQSRAALRDMKAVAAQTGKVGSPERISAEAKSLKVLVRLNPGFDASALNADGLTVNRTRGEFVTVSVPMNKLDALNNNPAVMSLSYKSKMEPMLDRATAEAGVDRIRAMEDLAQSYSGQNVVIGVIDKYLDPTHPMLCDPTTHKSRVKMYVTDGLDLLTTPEEMAAYVPSAGVRSGDHGTHVAGIAAGYYDDGTYSCKGIAPDAEILMADMTENTSDFMDIVEAFVDYAKEVKKPLVINMSIGIMMGPHDGTSPLSAYIDKVGKSGDATFCIAAGNYAQFASLQRHTFNSEDEVMKTFLRFSDEAPLEIWANDDRKFDVEFVLYDLQEDKALRTYKLEDDETYSQFAPMSESTELSKIYVGSIYVERGVNSNNNRYNYWVNCKGTITDPSRYLWGYIVHGKKGQRIMTTSSPYPLLVGRGLPGWGDGVEYGITNDLGSGQTPIVVGAYTTRESGTYADGSSYSTADYGKGEKDGEIGSFSSSATYDNGRSFPHFCAPGSFVISASSSYYMNNSQIGSDSKKYVKSVDFDGKTYYFRPMQGTSMATPFTTGVMALWLDAKPDLTSLQLRNIAAQTARKDSYVTSATNKTQWGAGKIDAYEGLKLILNGGADGISTVKGDKAFIYSAVGDNAYEFCIAGSTSVNAQVFNIQGQLVNAASANGSAVRVSLDTLPEGVYAVKVASNKGTHTVKIVKR